MEPMVTSGNIDLDSAKLAYINSNLAKGKGPELPGLRLHEHGFQFADESKGKHRSQQFPLRTATQAPRLADTSPTPVVAPVSVPKQARHRPQQNPAPTAKQRASHAPEAEIVEPVPNKRHLEAVESKKAAVLEPEQAKAVELASVEARIKRRRRNVLTGAGIAATVTALMTGAATSGSTAKEKPPVAAMKAPDSKGGSSSVLSPETATSAKVISFTTAAKTIDMASMPIAATKNSPATTESNVAARVKNMQTAAETMALEWSAAHPTEDARQSTNPNLKAAALASTATFNGLVKRVVDNKNIDAETKITYAKRVITAQLAALFPDSVPNDLAAAPKDMTQKAVQTQLTNSVINTKNGFTAASADQITALVAPVVANTEVVPDAAALKNATSTSMMSPTIQQAETQFALYKAQAGGIIGEGSYNPPLPTTIETPSTAPTATPSPSESTTPDPSSTPTPEASTSALPTPSPSASLGETPSPDTTPSAEPSATPTSTPSLSTSPSTSPSTSESAGGVIGKGTQTEMPTPESTTSNTATPTPIPSLSATPSATNTLPQPTKSEAAQPAELSKYDQFITDMKQKIDEATTLDASNVDQHLKDMQNLATQLISTANDGNTHQPNSMSLVKKDLDTSFNKMEMDIYGLQNTSAKNQLLLQLAVSQLRFVADTGIVPSNLNYQGGNTAYQQTVVKVLKDNLFKLDPNLYPKAVQTWMVAVIGTVEESLTSPKAKPILTDAYQTALKPAPPVPKIEAPVAVAPIQKPESQAANTPTFSAQYYQTLAQKPSIEFAKANYDYNHGQPVGPQITLHDVALLAYNAGFRGNDLRIAIALADGSESMRSPYIINSGAGAGFYAVGIWQMLSGPTEAWSVGLRDPQANLDPQTNANNAYTLKQGQGWNAWEGYTKGTHIQYMTAANEAATWVEQGYADAANPAAHLTPASTSVAKPAVDVPPKVSGPTHENTYGTMVGETVVDTVYYSQHDLRWASAHYSAGGNGTITGGGCGPSSEAIIISTLTDHKVTPLDMANYNMAHGYETSDGTAWSAFSGIANDYGLQMHEVGNTADVASALRNGSKVVVSGVGSPPFTNAGHIFVIRGLTADGSFLLSDPNNWHGSNIAWDPSTIAAGAKGYFVFSKA
jgi:hypothetical protein